MNKGEMEYQIRKLIKGQEESRLRLNSLVRRHTLLLNYLGLKYDTEPRLVETSQVSDSVDTLVDAP